MTVANDATPPPDAAEPKPSDLVQHGMSAWSERIARRGLDDYPNLARPAAIPPEATPALPPDSDAAGENPERV